MLVQFWPPLSVTYRYALGESVHVALHDRERARARLFEIMQNLWRPGRSRVNVI